MSTLADLFRPKRKPAIESGASYRFTEPALRSWFHAAIKIGIKIGGESDDIDWLADNTLEVFWKEFREKAEYER